MIPKSVLFRQQLYIRWNILIKTAFVLAFGIFLYQSTFASQDWDFMWNLFLNNLKIQNIPYLFFSLILMPINWLIESEKWLKLMMPLEQYQRKTAWKAVLLGISASIFTPNHIGEYLGRITLSKYGNKWKSVGALFLSSWVQVSFILSLGMISLGYLSNFSSDLLPFQTAFYVGGVGSLVLFLIIYFKGGNALDRLLNILQIKKMPGWFQKVNVLNIYDRKTLLWIFGLTFLRLGIYVSQFYLLLLFFGIQVDIEIGVSAILVSYLIQTGIPLPPFLALIARGEIVLLVWKSFVEGELSILSASYSLWVINILIPALIGLVVLFKVNILKSYGYAKP